MFCLNATGLKSLVVESQWGEWRRSLEFREELSSERRVWLLKAETGGPRCRGGAFDYGLTSVTPGGQGVERGCARRLADYGGPFLQGHQQLGQWGSPMEDPGDGWEDSGEKEVREASACPSSFCKETC